MKPNALTVVLNPNARKPKLKLPSIDRLRRTLGPDTRIHLTRNLDELEELMKAWKRENETVCFFGGDGSIACGLTLLIRHKGENGRLPPVLAVRAGTINMLCSILGFDEQPERTLERWARKELDTVRQIPTLKVEVEGEKPRYGFVFAWGVGYRVLREYYSRSKIPDVRDGMAVMAKAIASACLPNADQTALFRPEDLELSINGRGVGAEGMYSLLAGTIDRLSLGIRPFPPEPILPGGFHVSAMGLPVSSLAPRVPQLLFQFGDQRTLAKKHRTRFVCATGARELNCELTEGYTMDGEMFEIPGHAAVRISAGPVVQFWSLSGGR